MLLKLILKMVTPIHIFLYRMSQGRVGGRVASLPILLLITIGRKTGKTRTMPLGYMQDGDRYVIIGSNGGANSHPGWYFNLKNNPQTTIEIKGEKRSVTAEIITGEERSRLWQQLIAISPQYETYQKSTTREIPLVGLRG